MAIITNLQPPAGATVGPSTPLSFDVIDPVISQLRVFVWIVFKATGSVELAYDGNAWQALYGFSTIESVPGGRRFTVTRVGGWPSAPEIRVDSCACPPELGDGGGSPGLTPYTVGPEELDAPYQSLQEAIDDAEADGFGTNGSLGLPAFIYVLPGWAGVEDVTIPDTGFYIIGTSSWTQALFNGESATASLNGTVTIEGRSPGGRSSSAVVRWEGVNISPSTPGNAALVLDNTGGSAVLSIAKCNVRPRGPMITDTPADGEWLIMLDDVVWGGSLSTPSTIVQDFQARDSIFITQTTFNGVNGGVIDVVLERCRVRSPVAAVSVYSVRYYAKDCLFDNNASFAAGGSGVTASFVNCHNAASFTMFEYLPSVGIPTIDLDQCTHGLIGAANRIATLPQTFGYPDPDTEAEGHQPAIVEWRRRANLLTSDATPANILIADTFNRLFNGTVLVKGWITAKIAVGGDRSSYWREFEALYDCNSGVTTLVAGSLVLGAEFRTGTLTTCTAIVAVVSDQVVAQVTGEAATDIQWVVIYEIVSRP